MNAHRTRVDSPAALIELATDVMRRIQRVAVTTGPESRVRLMGELSLVSICLGGIEYATGQAAHGLPGLPSRHQLRQAERERLPAFQGGRLLPPPTRRRITHQAKRVGVAV